MDINIIGIKTLQLLLCFCILIVLHEGGHFAFCKLFGVRVEKFFLFIDPWVKLVSTKSAWLRKLFPRLGKGETEYGLGWLPLGGYVKISGMVDESMDTEQLATPKQPWEFRSQTVWKRFFIMVGGVLVNLITAFVIYWAVAYTWGEDRLPMQSFRDGFAYIEQAHSIGFLDGDTPVGIDGQEITAYSVNILRDISRAKTVTVLRQGTTVDIAMPEGGVSLLDMMEEGSEFFVPIVPSIIDSVVPESAAAKAGITAGMRICSVDGQPFDSWHQYDALMQGRTDRNMTLGLLTASGDTLSPVSLTLSDDMKMGVVRHSSVSADDFEHISYGIFSAVPAGLRKGWSVLTGYVSDLRYLFTAKGARSVGSFITIGSIFPDEWQWERFWTLTAFISIMLAVMNILPIPALDGGHVALLLVEAITGREPSQKTMEWIQRIGMLILIGLMLLAFGNDIIRWVLPHFMG